eukprot:894237-Alexandrium_andersonii.AAC.1
MLGPGRRKRRSSISVLAGLRLPVRIPRSTDRVGPGEDCRMGHALRKLSSAPGLGSSHGHACIHASGQ